MSSKAWTQWVALNSNNLAWIALVVAGVLVTSLLVCHFSFFSICHRLRVDGGSLRRSHLAFFGCAPLVAIHVVAPEQPDREYC